MTIWWSKATRLLEFSRSWWAWASFTGFFVTDTFCVTEELGILVSGCGGWGWGGEREKMKWTMLWCRHPPRGCPSSSGLYFCFSPSGKSFLKHWTNLTQRGNGRTLPCNTVSGNWSQCSAIKALKWSAVRRCISPLPIVEHLCSELHCIALHCIASLSADSWVVLTSPSADSWAAADWNRIQLKSTSALSSAALHCIKMHRRCGKAEWWNWWCSRIGSIGHYQVLEAAFILPWLAGFPQPCLGKLNWPWSPFLWWWTAQTWWGWCLSLVSADAHKEATIDGQKVPGPIALLIELLARWLSSSMTPPWSWHTGCTQQPRDITTYIYVLCVLCKLAYKNISINILLRRVKFEIWLKHQRTNLNFKSSYKTCSRQVRRFIHSISCCRKFWW